MQKRGWLDREMDKEYVKTLLDEIIKRDKKIWVLETVISVLVSVILLGIVTYFF